MSLSDVTLRLRHRLMRGAARPEAIAVLTERRVPPVLQHLHDRLLDEPVQHRRNAQLAHPTIRLGDFHPPDRLRLVDPAQQLLSNR
jgi:hypothetical protein